MVGSIPFLVYCTFWGLVNPPVAEIYLGAAQEMPLIALICSGYVTTCQVLVTKCCCIISVVLSSHVSHESEEVYVS